MKKYIKIIILVACFIFTCSVLYAQGEDEKLTQEQFAVILVNNMQLRSYLSIAPLPSDSISLLEGLGISPLKGWERKEYLTEEDYMVVMGKAKGKEEIIHREATEICQQNIELINRKWKAYFKKYKVWPTLKALLNNTEFFPEGPPLCPYGLRYKDKNNDKAVDIHYHPISNLTRSF